MRWKIDGSRLVVTAPGAEPEPHRLDAKGRMILPAGLELAEKEH